MTYHSRISRNMRFVAQCDMRNSRVLQIHMFFRNTLLTRREIYDEEKARRITLQKMKSTFRGCVTAFLPF